MENMYKKVRNYLIAMDEKNLLGHGRIGEVRRGYEEQQKRVLVFKIVSMPLHARLQQVLKTQQQLRQPTCIQEIYPVACSTSKCYIPYQFLPWTLNDFKATYLNNQVQSRKLLEQIVNSYSYLYFMGNGHNNLKASNILFDSKYKVVLADMILSTDFNATIEGDLMELGIVMYEMFYGRAYGVNDTDLPTHKPSKLIDLINNMIEGKLVWEDLFKEFNISNKYTMLKKTSNYQCHNRIVLLGHYAKKLSCEIEQDCFAKISIYKAIQRMLSEELACKQENPAYRKLLQTESKLIRRICQNIPHKKYVGIRDLMWNPQQYGFDHKQAVCFLMTLFPDFDHAYLRNTFCESATDGQLQIMYHNYLQRADLKYVM